MKPNTSCPQCDSSDLYRDGIGYTTQGKVQRWLCRSCGYRFRDGHNNSRTEHTTESTGRLCVIQEAKKLATTARETEQTLVGDERTAKGILLQYELYLAKEGYGENHGYPSCIRMLLNSGCDVWNPENVKEIIGKKDWKNGTKLQACYAYNALTKMLKISWNMPTYRQEEILPFIPTAKEIESLITGARSHRLTAYLQTLKETMADPGEAVRLRWIDINENSISINKPVKNHSPRQVPVSSQLIAMLKMLPKDSDRIFNASYRQMRESFEKVRRKQAVNLQNPRLKSITLTTFRHYGATMLYSEIRDILTIKKLLGHKNINSTMKYVQLIPFKDHEFETATATDIEEAKKLVSAGFEYVTDIQGIKLFRKPKRFIA